MSININPTRSLTPSTQPPRFGFALHTVDGLLSWVQKSRTREMIVEDVGGFGITRTAMDLGREYFYSQDGQIAGQPTLNIPAARERAIREILSVLTDNVSGGVIALGIAGAMNAAGKSRNMANAFVSKETLLLFQELAQGSPNQAEFLNRLARKISPEHAPEVVTQLKKAVASVGANGKACEKTCEDVAIAIAKKIQPTQKCLDRAITLSKASAEALGQTSRQSWMTLDNLAEDAAHFAHNVSKTPQTSNWGTRATNLLAETLKVNKARLPLSLGLAMGLTMAVPFLNRSITRKLDGTDMYPGEIGLRTGRSWENPNKPNWWAHNFPYLHEAFGQGKAGAFLLSLLPLPFAFGLLDCNKLPTALLRGKLSEAVNWPNQGFGKRLSALLQFGKKFPFTTPQQIAACFAFLIFSRLITSRSEIEFRERLVDSFGGLLMWQLVTPMLKHTFARKWAPEGLMKTVDGKPMMRTRTEVQRLVETGLGSKEQVVNKLKQLGTNSVMGKYVALSSASLGISLFVLGILEPYLAIKWTEWQVRQKNNVPQRNPFAPNTPQGQSVYVL